MRLVITGGSGNVGTALLALVRDALDVTSVVALATRPPPAVAPYDRPAWVTCDLGAPDSRWRLTEIIRGADAVVHLAWDVTGGGGRVRQRRTNVVGSDRVLAAAAGAGVPHLAYVSSVAATLPSPPAGSGCPRTGHVPGSPGRRTAPTRWLWRRCWTVTRPCTRGSGWRGCVPRRSCNRPRPAS